MLAWFRQFDDLLRGRKTATADLSSGRIDLPLGHFTLGALLFGAFYGGCMGLFSVLRTDPTQVQQLIASMVKLPALFLLTLLVTFPSLYVFSALMGSPLSFLASLRLALAAIVINVIVAASLGLIVAFFTLSTTSYSFMVILNVIALGIAGMVALIMLLQSLQRMTRLPFAESRETGEWRLVESVKGQPGDGGEGAKLPAPMPSPHEPPRMETARTIFRIWVLIYGLVGAQMGWVLRPFIGAPKMEFTWFRPRSGNFFEAVRGHLHSLFFGS